MTQIYNKPVEMFGRKVLEARPRVYITDDDANRELVSEPYADIIVFSFLV